MAYGSTLGSLFRRFPVPQTLQGEKEGGGEGKGEEGGEEERKKTQLPLQLFFSCLAASFLFASFRLQFFSAFLFVRL